MLEGGVGVGGGVGVRSEGGKPTVAVGAVAGFSLESRREGSWVITAAAFAEANVRKAPKTNTATNRTKNEIIPHRGR